MSPAVGAVLRALASAGLRRAGNGWTARCPAHEDKRASLSVGEGDGGRVLLHCHAGCDAAAVAAGLGLAMGDLFPDRPGEAPRLAKLAPVGGPGVTSNGHRDEGGSGKRIATTYAYREEGGGLLFEVVRFEPKGFAQRRPDGDGWTWGLGDVRRVVYRLPELLAAPPDAVVYVVEGEKDADALVALGFVATTNAGGAGKWRPEYSEALRGRWVVVVPDNDEPGRKHAQQVCEALAGVADRVARIELDGLPEKGDVSDWLAAGHTPDELRSLALAELDGGPPASDEGAPVKVRAPVPVRSPAVAAGPSRGPTRIALATIEPRPVDWLWQGRIPLAAVSSIDGMPGAGKSTLLAYVAACVTTGRALYGDERPPCEPKAVLWIGHEEGTATAIRPRFDAAEADVARVFVYDRMPSFPADYEWLRGQIRDTGAALVVVDPIDAYMDFGANGDSHRNGDVRARLAALAIVAEDTGAAVVMVRHWRKGGGVQAVYRAAGSLAYSALARAVASVVRDPDDAQTRIAMWSKVSGGTDVDALRFAIEADGTSSRVQWLGTDDRTADAIMQATDARASGRGSGEGQATATDAAETWLMEYLADRCEAPAREITAAGLLDGHTGRALRRARERLGIKARQVGIPGRRGGGEWVWRVPQLRRESEIPTELPGVQIQMPQVRARAPESSVNGLGARRSARDAELEDADSEAPDSDAARPGAPESNPANDGHGGQHEARGT